MRPKRWSGYQDFPRLSSFLAKDGFLPRWLQNRGEMLSFTLSQAGMSRLMSKIGQLKPGQNNQTAGLMRGRLRAREEVIVIDVPYHIPAVGDAGKEWLEFEREEQQVENKQ